MEKIKIQRPVCEIQDKPFDLIPIEGESYSFKIPKEIPSDEQITIKSTESEIKSKLMLVKPQLKKFNEYSNQPLDCFGNFKTNQAPNNDEYLQGVYGPHLQHKANYPKFPNIDLPTYGKIYWIGEKTWTSCPGNL